MKKVGLILMILVLIFSACHPDRVKIRGKVLDLEGTVKLMAEVPGKPGMSIIAQQEVKNGDIDLVTDLFKIPGRVWVDLAGKYTLEFIVDTKDQTWIQGEAKFIDQLEVNGVALEKKYRDLKGLFKEKYEAPIEPINKSIQKIVSKEKQTKDDEMMLGIYCLQKERYLRYRANYAKTLIEVNLENDLSLFLLKDELKDSLDLQKKLFKTMTVQNKESNIYKNLEEKLK